MECAFENLSSNCSSHDLVVDGLLGLAVSDAFGVPVEFMSRAEVRNVNLQEMEGNDTAPGFWSTWTDEIPQGAWSDDTSMTIAAMSSIIRNQGELDYDDIMKQFLAWWYEGEYTSLDYPFGLGKTVSHALMRYRNGTPALDCGGKRIRDDGNGALMRIFPFSIYCIYKRYDDENTLQIIRNGAGLTHGHDITTMSCFLYTLFLRECIRTIKPVEAFGFVFSSIRTALYRSIFSDEAIRAHEHFYIKDFFQNYDPDIIPEESGYVVDSLTIVLLRQLKFS